MKRHYAGPLGRLARLLLWEAGELTLSNQEARILIHSTRTKLLALQALLDEQENDDETSEQTDLPWKK